MPTSLPSSSPSPPSKASPSPVIPITVSLVFVLLLVSVMFITLHLRRRNKQRKPQPRNTEVRAGETVARTHPAALMITPAEGKGNPRFVHTPGTNMRIATRRPDGAWEFSDPRAPFTPSIIADAEDAPTDRYSSARSLDPGNYSPPSRNNYPYSYTSETPGSSSTSELISPSTTSPWGAPNTPHTADSDLSAAPWRVVSPAPSTARTAFYPPPSASGSRSALSPSGSFLDLGSPQPDNPFRNQPAPPPRVLSPARERLLPSRSPSPLPSSARASPEPATSSHRRPPRAALASPSLPSTPAAFAKEAESRAARAIRAGYDSVDRYSEYAQQDEGLPAY